MMGFALEVVFLVRILHVQPAGVGGTVGTWPGVRET